ncbi:ABC transporter ATP-binding protein [Lysinibacillus telephonicus]|nr:ABC transporter ATP-binding protein [Lysinibacillus telephonicus]
MMNEIRFEKVKKSYGKVEVVKSLDFSIRDGERLILLGPSGCGKSTTLRMIAGLESITEGRLYMGGREVNDVPSGQRDVAMVFQNYALYPHMTVKQNITYALRTQKMTKDEIEKRLKDALQMLGLEKLENRLPKDLSGGQRQRVALARAVVKQSPYFLLDEPLSNLDAQLRGTARKELVRIHEKFKQTMVYVTHDQIEAMTIGDRIALLNNGILQMLDTPENVYHRPANIFTATFIGSPAMNVHDVRFIDGQLQIDEQFFGIGNEWSLLLKNYRNKQVKFGVRPEHIHLSTEMSEGRICGVVNTIENLGAQYAVYVQIGSKEWIALSPHRGFSKGQRVYLEFDYNNYHFFDPETTNTVGYPSTLNLNSKIPLKVEV